MSDEEPGLSLHPLVAAIRDAGWDGEITTEELPGRVAVRFGGRLIEGLTMDACRLFIVADTRAKVASMNALDDESILGARLASGDFDDD